MPYTSAQRAFFNLCAHSPGKAKKPCPKGSKELAAEANSLPLKPSKKRRPRR